MSRKRKPTRAEKPRPALTVALIQATFASAWSRGDEYWKSGRVHINRYNDDAVQAEVLGREPLPYKTTVGWQQDGDWSLYGLCTCPIGGYCKHGVAAALAWLDQIERRKSATQSPAPAMPVASTSAAVTSAALRQDPSPAGRADAPVRAASIPALAPPPPSARFDPTMLDPDPFERFDAAEDRDEMGADAPRRRTSTAAESVLWLFWWGVGCDELLICPVLCKRLKSGRWGAPRVIELADEARQASLRAVPALQLPWLFSLDPDTSTWHESRWYHPLRDDGQELASAIVDSGYAVWVDPNGPVLRAGPARALHLHWDIDAAGEQRLRATVDGGARVLGDTWSWYVDPDSGLFGPVESAISEPERRRLARIPAVPAEHSARAFAAITARIPGAALPPLRPLTIDAERVIEPRGLLLLEAARIEPWRQPKALLSGCEVLIEFRYDGLRVAAGDRASLLRRLEGDRVCVFPRDLDYERHVARFLATEGFNMAAGAWPDRDRVHARWRLSRPFADHATLRTWLDAFVVRAAAQRIDVETRPEFPVQVGADLGVTEVDLVEVEDGWFEARLGLIVDGQRIDLLPLLLAAATDPGRLARDGLAVMLPDGRRAWLSPERLAPMIALLEDGEWDGEQLRLARPRLTAFDPPPDWRFTPDRRLAAFLDELRAFDRLRPLDAPADFAAQLRPYQRLGLAWLDFLRRYGFGGVLADDMGLGKTVQCLAHIAREREAGRLDRPVLVVCPTSVVPNWSDEAARFVPGLRVLVLERGDRSVALASLTKHDLVVTSYALLPRDIDELAAVDWHMLVLDEAQWLKNKATKAWHSVNQLRAATRLAMTGTPVENHLGELKAQLDLVMPGLLGSDRGYAERYRGPIERGRDATVEVALRKRIGPFVLRRRKDDVAIDLPPRTTLVRRIAFEEAQQDLYETLRARMEKRVRDALKQRGLAGSHITVLDALLKLRQVCCDPRLVDLPAARKVEDSAKRKFLMEMLPTLVDEGRRVLLFSQFTSMLDLIETDLRGAGIEHVRLDGGTRDRATPVKRFQAGAVPVFLISLKAGGVGLNLTRADTVILYDPWWNPAVESQAIDRAHRIGQDKPVFVHELQCIGTVEEKMATLKARKRALADAVLAEGEAAVSRLDADSLLALFAPS